MDKYVTRTTAINVLPENDALFSEQSTTVRIVDEAAGEFVEVEQEEGKIRIDPKEWPIMAEAIGQMIAECRKPK